MNLSNDPLRILYQRLISGDASPDVVLDVIRRRGDMAADIFALTALEMPQQEIDEYIPRLEAALATDVSRDPAEDAADREFARIQLEVLEREIQRRATMAHRIDSGEAYIPARTDLLASVMGLGPALIENGTTAPYATTFRQIVDLVRRAALDTPTGARQVATVLREVTKLPSEANANRLDPWIRWAMALQLMSDPVHGYGGERLDLDPLTVAEAGRARRIYYAVERSDPRYEGVDWPLDLDGLEIADLIERADAASRFWADNLQPDEDLLRYRSRIRTEESGRPAPHEQIVPEDDARLAADHAGGFSIPLVYRISPRERVAKARQIWTHGLPSPSRAQVGLELYPIPGDPRVRWGAPPHPLGLLCAVCIPASAVLHVHHKEIPEHDEIFNELTRQATAKASAGQDYRHILRELFLERGFQAISRHDIPKSSSAQPGVVLVLDPSPTNIKVIREAVPSFMRGERPVILPQRRDVARDDLGRVLS